ncbi:MAG: nitrile hydratase accessory protein [Solirubrobacterales bacterium]|nr:nitrile hydratase accessory protein [Solirubrobacterales bacterium]
MADPTLELEGAAALPRSNGEPVFSAPWQSRAFGMAMALSEQGAFEWEDFRVRLIAEIADAEAAVGGPEGIEDEDGSLYYSRWLAALSAVLAERDVVASPELAGREEEFRTGVRREVY